MFTGAQRVLDKKYKGQKIALVTGGDGAHIRRFHVVDSKGSSISGVHREISRCTLALKQNGVYKIEFGYKASDREGVCYFDRENNSIKEYDVYMEIQENEYIPGEEYKDSSDLGAHLDLKKYKRERSRPSSRTRRDYSNSNSHSSTEAPKDRQLALSI